MVPCEAVLMFISDNSVCSEGVEVSREVRNIFTIRPYLLKAHTTISKLKKLLRLYDKGRVHQTLENLC